MTHENGSPWNLFFLLSRRNKGIGLVDVEHDVPAFIPLQAGMASHGTQGAKASGEMLEAVCNSVDERILLVRIILLANDLLQGMLGELDRVLTHD